MKISFTLLEARAAEMTQDDADRLAKESYSATADMARYGIGRLLTKRRGEWWVKVAQHRPCSFLLKSLAEEAAGRIIDGMARKSRQAQATVFAGEYLRGELPVSEIPAFMAHWGADTESHETSRALGKLAEVES